MEVFPIGGLGVFGLLRVLRWYFTSSGGENLAAGAEISLLRGGKIRRATPEDPDVDVDDVFRFWSTADGAILICVLLREIASTDIRWRKPVCPIWQECVEWCSEMDMNFSKIYFACRGVSLKRGKHMRANFGKSI